MHFNLQKANQRLFIILVGVSLIFFLIALRIIFLSDIVSENKSRIGLKQILRGNISDRRSVNLAITEEASTIGINPKEIIDPQLTARFLAGYLDMDYNTILQKIYLYQNRNYFLLKRKIDNYIAELILDLNLPGVYRDFEYKRIYPANTLASNLIGFVRKDTLKGMAGIELIYDQILTTPSTLFSGYSIELSIDSLIQYELEKVLQEGFEKSKAKKAIGIMMKLDTGEILAMANLPNFDPNYYYRENAEYKSNWAITYQFEPGSLMKPFFAAILINEYPDITNKEVYCNGEFNFRTGNVRCLRKGKIHAHGKVDLEKIIEVSCNVGIIQLTNILDKNTIYKYLLELGFNKPTHIVPENWEANGYIPKIDNWVESTPYYLPIGQGMLATPIQILTAFSALVNDGILIKPVLVRKIESEDKKLFETFTTEVKNTSLRKQTLKILKEYLYNVVEKGTGKLANVSFTKILGKTGTAQKSGPYGYLDEFTVSFIGAFPFSNPEYIVLIIYDGVNDTYSGGNLAAPTFAKFLQNIKKILFSQLYTEEIDITKKIQIEKNNKLLKYKEELPDFKDASLKEIFEWKKYVLEPYNKKNHTNIEIEIFGNGYVIKQYPQAGKKLNSINKIQLYLNEENF
ncbi:MAG: penicillin-binding protein 3 [Leptospiraceae bacterium]|nr:MAG: penicillin-binding protein 3 [Leptospiraceae bacterium]